MGAWGAGPFDNDDAADWAYLLTDDANDSVVRDALVAVVGGSADARAASAAVGAAAIVAAGAGRPGGDLPREVRAWIDARRDDRWSALLPTAVAALDAVLADSELAELWAESGDGAWLEAVADLRGRLAG